MNLQERAREVARYQAGDAELLTEMADRIEALEADLANRLIEVEMLRAEVRDLRSSVAAIPDHKGRIEALEVALAKVGYLTSLPGFRTRDAGIITRIAREALGEATNDA